ncbi:MAG: hypothetical protein L6R37_003531 [Teloschistes peruensis]|nr:MAG: hypothetical protein L6R37_003531 [Teloschistes peruensis]
MASSVFFRFKSQKEPTRVAFDGTGISVFELKREIITLNRLGDGTDFELVISSEDTGEEYDDDTLSIPRSTTVIAKRLPAFKSGRGGAARYVSGKMPQNAKNVHRTDVTVGGATSATQAVGRVTALTDMDAAQSEEDRIAAVLKLGADQWAQQQQDMAHATPVYRSGPSKAKQANVPDHPPPSGYVCYRCGEKGHWIQACPKNDDPSYVNRLRVKRTTGIPRSFLKTIEKPTAMANDGTVDETKQPAGVMVNADGEWVIAEPDKASWDQYQARTKVSAAAQEAAAQGNKELQERGLECPIDKRLFIEPSQTPCCQKTYCHECITNALLENDLRCPHCSTENILLDDLKPDEQMIKCVRDYENEQQVKRSPEAESVTKGKDHDGKVPMKGEVTEQLANPGADEARPSETSTDLQGKKKATSETSNSNIPRKRSADTTLENSAKKITTTDSSASSHNQARPPLSSSTGQPQTMGNVALPVPTTFMNMPMSMMPMMPMMPPANGMFGSGTMGNPFMGGTSGDWNAGWNGGFIQQPIGMTGVGHMNGGLNGQFGPHNLQMSMNSNFTVPGGMNGTGVGRGTFSNQQRNHFTGPRANEEDSAYFRKPVNPHRHQARRNVNRPTDYHEI